MVNMLLAIRIRLWYYGEYGVKVDADDQNCRGDCDDSNNNDDT